MPIVRGHQPNFQQFQPQVIPNAAESLFQGLGSGLGTVLAAMQQKREEDYRKQVLAQKTLEAQQQALYQQGMLGVYQGQLSAQTTKAANEQAALGQVGGVQRRAMGGMPSSGAPVQPVQQPGNFTQAQQAMPVQPQFQQQHGNMTQGQDAGLFHQVLAGGAATLAPAQGNADIFGGVADENVPAAVQGLQEVQALQPKPPEATNDQKNFAALLEMRDPQMAQLFWKLIGPKPGATQTVNVGAGETAFDKQWNEEQAKALTEVEGIAKRSANAAPGFIQSYGLVRDGKVYAGFAAKQKLGLSRLALALGVPEELVKTADTQTLEKLTGDQVLAKMADRTLGSGTAVSDTDLRFTQSVSGQDLSKEPAALMRTYRINLGASMMLQQDAVEAFRDQAQYASPQAAKQLLGRAAVAEKRLGGTWIKYAEMLQDEGETIDQILDRMPPRLREERGAEIRKLLDGRQRANPHPENPYR